MKSRPSPNVGPTDGTAAYDADFFAWTQRTAALLRATRVAVDAAHPRLDAVLAGERIDPERHELLADVKAVTFHDLRVERTATGWDAHVTLDV